MQYIQIIIIEKKAVLYYYKTSIDIQRSTPETARAGSRCPDTSTVCIRQTLTAAWENRAGEKCNTTNTTAFQGSLNDDSTQSYPRKGFFESQISSWHSPLSTNPHAPLLSMAALPSHCSKFSSYLAQLTLLLGDSILVVAHLEPKMLFLELLGHTVIAPHNHPARGY